MKFQTSAIIEEYTNVLTGHVGLYAYRLINLCIKADPVTLLGVTVDIEGLTMNIEDVALVGTGDDEFSLKVYPKSEKNILIIGKAIAEEHPEFLQEMETLKVKDEQEIRYIKLTMPEVNEERKKVIMEAVKILHDDCVAKLKASNAYYMGKLTIEQVGASKEEVEEAKSKFDEVTEEYNKSCESVTEEKNKEVEEAYKAYLERKEQEKEGRKEIEDAEGKEAMNTYKS